MHAAAVCRGHCACLRAALGCPAQQLLNEGRQSVLHRGCFQCICAANCLVVAFKELMVSLTACPYCLCRRVCFDM